MDDQAPGGSSQDRAAGEDLGANGGGFAITELSLPPAGIQPSKLNSNKTAAEGRLSGVKLLETEVVRS